VIDGEITLLMIEIVIMKIANSQQTTNEKIKKLKIIEVI